MNDTVTTWNSLYGADWPFVLNRRAKMREDLTKIETTAFLWGREAAQMLGMDKDRE